MTSAGSYHDPASVGILTMKTIRLLIADDNPQVRRDLSTVLQLAGKESDIQVDVLGEAENGLQAVQQAMQLQLDVVIMDLEMPLLDGWEATRAIKASDSNISVLVLSVHGGETDRMKALHAGADSFIVKGTPVSEIIQKISSLVPKGDIT